MSVREAQLVTAETGGFAHQLLAVYTFEALGAARGTNSGSPVRLLGEREG